MSYRIDGKIDGHEDALFTAALFLTELILNGDKRVVQMKTPAIQSVYRQLQKADKDSGVSSGIVIEHEKVQELHMALLNAHRKLKEMEKTKKEPSLGRVKLKDAIGVLDHVAKDVGMAVKDNQPLRFVTPQADKPDLRFLPKVNQLLERFGVSSSNGRAGVFSQGRVIEYFDQAKKDLLVIYVMDTKHTDAAQQRMVRDDILGLTGVPVLGIEAQTGDYNFTQRRNVSITVPDGRATLYPDSCVSDGRTHVRKIDERNVTIPAGVAVECILVSAIDTFGAQSSDYLEQDEATHAIVKQITGFSRLSQAFSDQMEVVDFYNYKGRDATENAVEHLKEKNDEKQQRVAVLVYGKDHYYNIVETLKAKGVNFLVVSYSS